MNIIDYMNKKMKNDIEKKIRPVTSMLFHTVTPVNWGYTGNYWFITLKFVKGVDTLFVNYFIYNNGEILVDFKSRLEPSEPYNASIDVNLLEAIVGIGRLLRDLVEKIDVTEKEHKFFTNVTDANKYIVLDNKRYHNLGVLRYNGQQAIILEPMDEDKEPNLYDLSSVYQDYVLSRAKFKKYDNNDLMAIKGDKNDE